MSMLQEQTIPLYEEIVNGYNKLSVSGSTGRESGNLRRSRESAFDKFRTLGFPSIKNEDWKYTNITRFLKEGYALEVANAIRRLGYHCPPGCWKRRRSPASIVTRSC